MLRDIEAYEHFVYSLAENYSEIDFSKLIVKRKGIHFAFVEGEIYFKRGFRLKIFEAVDFDLGRIESYGYEIYRDDEKLYYYDSHPHPNDPLLAKTHPHHKHIPPDIKHHRIPAEDIKFDRPNLPFLIEEIIEEINAFQ
jgi:hypothetical protein